MYAFSLRFLRSDRGKISTHRRDRQRRGQPGQYDYWPVALLLRMRLTRSE